MHGLSLLRVHVGCQRCSHHTAQHPTRATSPQPAAMITSCARIMAVATIATTRCGSFLYSGSRYARSGARVGKHFAALRLSSTQLENSSSNSKSTMSRGNADDASLDSSLISTNPELVIEHMKARRMGDDSVEAVNRIRGGLLASNKCATRRLRSWVNCNTWPAIHATVGATR